jgi:hypothetical protein
MHGIVRVVREVLMTLTTGFHPAIPMNDYRELDALGSTRLEWLGISPLHYRHMLTQPPGETEATRRGTALHLAVLEPELFSSLYTREPDPAVIAPENAKPRATKAYKDACAVLEAEGLTILKEEEWARVEGMAAAVRTHPHAKRVLERGAEREVTGLWRREGRLCRGRFDVLGDGILADLKTTRSLRDFSPWTITKRGYHRQMAWYRAGLSELGRPVKAVFLVAVESVAPYDVGVFVMDDATLNVGEDECAGLIRKLEVCELTGEYPGMFPDIVPAQLTDAFAIDLAGAEVED